MIACISGARDSAWNAACFERLSIGNYDDRPHRIVLGIRFSVDFADLFEVRGTWRERRGTLIKPELTNSEVMLSYLGLDDRKRTTTLRFDPEPQRLGPGEAIYELDLAPGERQSLFIEVDCSEPVLAPPPPRAFFMALRDSRRALRSAASQAASIETSNHIFNEAARRSVADLYMLKTDLPEGPYPYAGIPWFSAIFGRDGIITALETLWLDPSIARGVLRRLAAMQAVDVDPVADAEPGKILHEARYGEMAALGEVPFGRYYGSIDFNAALRHARRRLSRPDRRPRNHRSPVVEHPCGARMDRKLWRSRRRRFRGICQAERQGTRQSRAGRTASDAVFHADGALAKGPIALVEVQAYVYAAWRAAQEIARRLGDDNAGGRFAAKAKRSGGASTRSFFDEALGTYVLALDGDKRRCRVRSSNAGHALFAGHRLPGTGCVSCPHSDGKRRFLRAGAFELSRRPIAVQSMSYHNGSVWPHDNALIAMGMARYGFRQEAARIFEGLFDASTYVEFRRLPELFCGFPRQQTRGPTFYPVACIPQAWPAAARSTWPVLPRAELPARGAPYHIRGARAAALSR